MMKNTTSLFSFNTYTRNWYVQKWLLVIGFIALLGFNAKWVADTVLPKVSDHTKIKDKPAITTIKSSIPPTPVNNIVPLAAPKTQKFMEICDNGIDDDGDGLIDCYDPDCENATNCDGFFYGSPIPSCNFTASTGNFTVTEIWNTKDANSSATPLDQRATVMVGDMDGDGIPEIVGKNKSGNLYIFNGQDGTIEVNVSVNNSDAFTSVAIGDVDNDGLGEVFFFDSNGRLHRYDYANGTLTNTFSTSTDGNASLYTPNLADFNHDGVPEVYVGNKIYSSVDGTKLVDGGSSASISQGAHDINNSRELFSIAIDVLPDDFCPDCSGLEIVAGNVVYAVNVQTGNITPAVTAPAGLNDGVTAVADVDVDGDIDGIVVSQGVVYVWDLQTSTQLYSTYTIGNGTGKGGRPNVGNFDSDAELEIGVAGRNIYVVLDPTGSPSGGTLVKKWDKTGLVDNSERTSSTVFDFDGDGISEVVYSEEQNMVVYNGTTGDLKTSIASPSGTRYDNPVIADVNGDGQTEIIVTAQDTPGPSNSGTDYVRCFKSTDLPWRPSRPVWNQHNYFIVNVNDDLTIPRVQQNSLILPSSFDGKPYKVILNTFLNQASIYDVAGDHIFPAPDIRAEINGDALRICQDGTNVPYSFLITNGGSADLPAGTNIAVFSDDPYTSNNPNLLQTLSTPSVIPENGTLLMSGTITGAPTNMTKIYILLNHNHATVLSSPTLSYPLAANTVVTGIAECSYADNIITKDVEQSTPPDNSRTVNAGGNIVCSGTNTTITVVAAQAGVMYRLRKGTTVIAGPETGNGTDDIVFNTDNLTADATYNVLATSGSCSAVLNTTQTVKVINQGLTLEAASSTVCSGEQTEIKLLKSQEGVTYQLRNGGTPIGGTATGNGGTISFSTGPIINNPTTFNIFASGGACAGVQLTNTASVATTAAPDPSLTVTADFNTVCSGGTANIMVLASTAGVNYQLRNGTTKLGVAIPGNGNTLTFETPAITGATTFNVLATRDGCTDVQLTQEQTITTGTLNTSGFTVGASATTICTGSSTNVTLNTSQTDVSYQLRNDADNSNVGTAVPGSGAALNFDTGNLTNTTTFNILASRPGCASAELGTVMVTVNDNPLLDRVVGATNSSVCSGEGTKITIATSETGVNYQLRNNADNSLIGSANPGNGGLLEITVNSLTATTTFNVLATRNACPPQPLNNTVTVTVLEVPDAARTVDISSNTVCSGESVTLTVRNAQSNVSYQLKDGGTNVNDAQTGNGSDLAFTVNNLTSNANFSIQATNLATSCVQDLTTTHNVTVNPLPNNGLDVTTNVNSVCVGDNANITVRAAEAGFSYQLNDGTNNVGTAQPGANADLTFALTNLATTANYRVIVTNNTTNCSTTLTQTADITVNDFTATITNGANVNFCGSSGVLMAPSIAGASYQWQKDAANIGTDSNQLTVTESGNYIVIITVGSCTKASPASVVTLTTPPVSSVAAVSNATNNTVCAGENIVFTATPTNGGTNPTYQWRVNGGDVAGANQSTFTTNSLTSGDAVSVVMTADLTCATPVTSNDVVVTINALPTVTFTGVDVTLDNNNQVTIDEGSSVTINLTGGASYTWTPNTGINSLSNDGSEAVLAPASTITYAITATSTEGCVSNGSDTLRVVVRPSTDIFIPSLFSPNGDGKNDRFVVRGTGIRNIDFRVFDRSGNLIYQTTSVDEAMNTGWDGTKNGVNQPIGMYTWSINGAFVDGRRISFQGASAGKINLLR